MIMASPVDSSDSLSGGDALVGFADKVRGWTETAWSNSKASTKTATTCQTIPIKPQFRENYTGLDGDSMDKYEGRDEVHGRGWRRHWEGEGLRQDVFYDRKPNGDQ